MKFRFAVCLFALACLACSQSIQSTEPVSGEATAFPPVIQVDGKPFFPIGYYTSATHSTVQEAYDYLSTQHAQGMNTALSCYNVWKRNSYMENEMQGAALADMKVVMEVHRRAVKGEAGYPLSLIDSQIDLVKGYPNLLGWYLIDEPELQGLTPEMAQARYAQVKTLDPNRPIWVVHYAYLSMNPARPALDYLAAEPPPYCDVLMTDTYPVSYGSATNSGPLWWVALESKAHTEMAVSHGKQAYINVVQAQGNQDFNTRLPTYSEQRYLCYAPIVCGARGLFFWMYESYSTPQHRENIVGPIAREISKLSTAILSNSTAISVTSDRDTDSTGHGIADVMYMFGEDSLGGYLIAVNNTASSFRVNFQITGGILATKYGTGNASVPVLSELRNVTISNAGSPDVWTLSDTFTPYDVNIYRLYTLEDRLSIDMGSPDVPDGIIHSQAVDGHTVVVANMGGVNCRRNSNPAASPPDNCFYFKISDSFAFQGSRPAVSIDVRYYDFGTGTLDLQYDADGEPYKSAGTIVLTGTNVWKTRRFYVADAYFGNRQTSGADFRIMGSAGITFYLDSIVIRPCVFVNAGELSRAKELADGTDVVLSDIPVTAGTDHVDGDFYVEATDRSCGIRVRPLDASVNKGTSVNVAGTLATLDSGERAIIDATVTPSANPADVPAPLGMKNRDLGGGGFCYDPGPPQKGQQGVQSGAGPNNIGLLVTTWGRMTGIEDSATPKWFTIDDGSGAEIKCVMPDTFTIDPAWQHVVVTGVSSCEKTGGELSRVLIIRTQDDVRSY